MKNDDYFVITYKILAYLYTKLKKGEPIEAEYLLHNGVLFNINYLNNPSKYCKDWDTFTDKYKAGLIKHWKKEIDNFDNSINNRVEELQRRGEEYE